jgi:hypothetical protein
MFAGSGAVAAYADDPTPVGQGDDGNPIWQESDEDLIPAPDADPEGGDPFPFDTWDKTWSGDNCTTHRVYSVSKVKNTFDIKYRETDDNSQNSQSDDWTVVVTTAGTTTYGLSVGVEAELSLGIFSKVKASLNGSVSKSMSTTVGTTHRTTVGAGHITRAEYGIWRQNFKWKTYWLYPNCSKGTVKSGSGHAPYSIKWRWIKVK